ncbi:MAG: Do family serine endopeptidase [Thermoanaerobaculia bacterium]|nr:Do family serine endopeptidase [Thermoanaerobaculia bacterium]
MAFRTKQWLPLLALVVVSVLAGIAISAEFGLTPKSDAQSQPATASGEDLAVTALPSFADVAERVMPAVVSITTTELVSGDQSPHGGMDPFDFFFRGPRPQPDEPFEEREQVSGGSGFIITPDGYILTNNHVVQDANRVEVRLGEEDREYEAEVVGRDPATDLALIKIEADGPLPTVNLGDSENVRIGDWALAIGNPVGFENSLTVGVVSAKGRALGLSQATSSFENFIQTDAAINFGNSGGPLLNIRGEVIGINTAIVGRSFAQNIGFATPVNVAKRIYPMLRDEGRVVRGYIGVNISNITSARQMRAFGLDSRDGALVQQVNEGPAQDAGVEAGDVIVEVDGNDIENTRELIDYVSSKRPGDEVVLTVVRDGERRRIEAEVGERPDFSLAATEREGGSAEPAQERLGLAVREIDNSVRRQYGIDSDVDGLLVTGVRGLSPASDAGLNEGDVITRVNGRDISTIGDFRRIVEDAESGDLLRLYVTRFFRGGQSTSSFAIVEVP